MTPSQEVAYIPDIVTNMSMVGSFRFLIQNCSFCRGLPPPLLANLLLPVCFITPLFRRSSHDLHTFACSRVSFQFLYLLYLLGAHFLFLVFAGRTLSRPAKGESLSPQQISEQRDQRKRKDYASFPLYALRSCMKNTFWLRVPEKNPYNFLKDVNVYRLGI